MSSTFKDYYAILEVRRNCNAAEIKTAYRAMALARHPDKNRRPNATAEFQLLSEAHEVLSDPFKRSTYNIKWDSQHSSGTRSTSCNRHSNTPSSCSGHSGCRRQNCPNNWQTWKESLEAMERAAEAQARARAYEAKLEAARRGEMRARERAEARAKWERARKEKERARQAEEARREAATKAEEEFDASFFRWKARMQRDLVDYFDDAPVHSRNSRTQK